MTTAPRSQRRLARAATLAATVVALTLLLAQCVPGSRGHARPNWGGGYGNPPQPSGSAAAGTLGPPEAPQSGGGVDGSDAEIGAGSTAAPESSAPSGTAAQTPTISSPPSTGSPATPPSAGPAVDALCRQLTEFRQPIKQIDAGTLAELPPAIREQSLRIKAGYVDDPDYELHEGAADMRAVWEWVATTCPSGSVAYQRPGWYLQRFEDVLAGLAPVDVCAALTTSDVSSDFGPVGSSTGSVADSGWNSDCQYFPPGVTDKALLDVQVWYVPLVGGGEVWCHDGTAVDVGDRACLRKDYMTLTLTVERRSVAFELALRTATVGDDPADAALAEQLVAVYAALAPRVLPGEG